MYAASASPRGNKAFARESFMMHLKAHEEAGIEAGECAGEGKVGLVCLAVLPRDIEVIGPVEGRHQLRRDVCHTPQRHRGAVHLTCDMREVHVCEVHVCVTPSPHTQKEASLASARAAASRLLSYAAAT